MSIQIKVLLLCFLCGPLLAGVVSATPSPGIIPVVASIIPLGDFCRQLGGERVTVQVLMPPGASPHVFEPSPSVIAKANQARVFVYIGAGLEPWAEKILRSRGTTEFVVVEAVQGIPLLRDVGKHHESRKSAPAHEAAAEKSKPGGASHGHESGNPHIWLDPILAQEICRHLAAALIQVDPEHRPYYETRLQHFLGELQALHEEIKESVNTWRLRDYVCFHPAYTYFARRYGLREVGVIEVAPGREPTPRHLQEIVAAIRRHGLRVVFAEPQLSPRVAQVIAQEAGVKVLVLDPIGGRPPYGSDYLQMMRYNLAILEEAMK